MSFGDNMVVGRVDSSTSILPAISANARWAAQVLEVPLMGFMYRIFIVVELYVTTRDQLDINLSRNRNKIVGEGIRDFKLVIVYVGMGDRVWAEDLHLEKTASIPLAATLGTV